MRAAAIGKSKAVAALCCLGKESTRPMRTGNSCSTFPTSRPADAAARNSLQVQLSRAQILIQAGVFFFFFVHPPCTAESFPTLASPGCRSPWESVPRWESPPRCRTMESPRSLQGRTWLIRPTPYETSSSLRAAVVSPQAGGGVEGDKASLSSRVRPSLRPRLGCRTLNRLRLWKKTKTSLPKKKDVAHTLSLS